MSENLRPSKYSSRPPRRESIPKYYPDIKMGQYSVPASQEKINFEGKVDFVFCEHTPDNLHRALEEVRKTNPDIVAIEHPGLSQAEKTLTEMEINRIIRADSTIAAMVPGYQNLGPVDKSVCAELFGSEARIELIDISKDDPNFSEIVDPANQALLDWNRANGNNDPNIDTLYSHYIDLYAQSNALREELLINQITQILIENPSKKVTVLLGAAHTHVHHEISKLAPSCRLFAPEPSLQPWEKSEKMRFSDSARDIRKKRFKLLGRRAIRDSAPDHMHSINSKDTHKLI